MMTRSSSNTCEICGHESIGIAVVDVCPLTIEVCEVCLQRPVIPVWLANHWDTIGIRNETELLNMEVYYKKEYITVEEYLWEINNAGKICT